MTCLGVSDIVILTKAGEALDLLAEAAPVERFPSLRRDLAALYAGYYIAELLSDLTDSHDPHPKLFDAARITLRHLGDAELRSRTVLRFELACLRELGVMPVSRGSVLIAAATSYRKGERCRSGFPAAECSARPAGPDSRTSSHCLSATSRPFASSPARGTAWRELDFRRGKLSAARDAAGAVISHALGHRSRLRPLLGV